MNEIERELESNATSSKHRIGKTIFLGGLILFSISFIVGFIRGVMFYTLILTGSEFQVDGASYYIESLFILVSFVMIIVGLIILGSSLFSNEGLRNLQLGPYVN